MEQETKNKDYICTEKDQNEIRYAQDALYVLNGKWRMLVIIAIYNGHHRYRQIAQNVPGITFAMLSKELKSMELNNLIDRIEDPDFSKQVHYQLTVYCQSVYPLIEHLISWGKTHRRAIG